MRLPVLLCIVASALVALTTVSAAAQPSFIAFETGPVRPLAIEGSILAVVNTPDNQLETFNVVANGITRRTSISLFAHWAQAESRVSRY